MILSKSVFIFNPLDENMSRKGVPKYLKRYIQQHFKDKQENPYNWTNKNHFEEIVNECIDKS